MTQWFDQDGRQMPVTVVEVGPCVVKDLRTKDRDGYVAVQLAFDPVKEKNVTKPRMGQFKKSKMNPHRFIKEIRTEEVEGLKIGVQVGVDSFKAGDYVDVQGTSIGRGFQGVVKRHNFSGGEKSHGCKHGRETGSIGVGSAFPSRVIKGTKMAGQMGNCLVTVQNLKIAKVDKDENVIALVGAVPGSEGGYLVIRSALKSRVSHKWKVQGKEAEVPKQEEAVKAETKKEESSQEAATEAPKAAPQEPTSEKPESKGPEQSDNKA